MLKLAAVVTVLATATTAFAQPGAEPTSDDTTPATDAQPVYLVPAPQPAPIAQPAPQNEPWSNVSHINGQLVPVGQRSDYLISYKRVNISTNPVGWLAGFYGISASYALNQHVVLRGDANYFHGGLFEDSTGYELGVSLPIYFRRAYSGPFIEPGLITRSMTHKTDGYDFNGNPTGMTSTTDTMVGPEVLAGYHWTFDSGLNVAFALGLAKNLNTMSASEGDNGLQPAGYFRVGYAF